MPAEHQHRHDPTLYRAPADAAAAPAGETPHPAKPDAPLRGGPQMVQVSRDGRRAHQVRLQGGDASSDSLLLPVVSRT